MNPVGALPILLDTSSQALCACDLKGRIVWSNLAFGDTFGRDRAQSRGLELDTLLGDDYRFVSALIESRSEAMEAFTRWQTPVDREDGIGRWIEWTARVEEDRGLVFLAGRDITEERIADATCRSGANRFRAILAHCPTPIFVLDGNGRTLLGNDAYFGLSEDSLGLIGMHVADVVRSGVAAVLDMTLELVEGPQDVRMTLSPIIDVATETISAVCGTTTDMTERRRAESSLVGREQVLNTVLRASPDIISIMDRSGKLQQLSSAEEVILGRSQVDATDDLFALVHPDDFDTVASALITMATGSVSRMHVRCRVKHADGHWVTFDSRGQAVVDEKGAFVGAVVVSRDISDRLKSEQRLDAIREAAEKASSAKSEFLSKMSHELRTPLNAILGFAELLKMDELGIQQLDAVEHIENAGRHLLDLINEVLDMARIDSGHLELSIKPVRIAQVVAAAAELTRPIADRAEITVNVLSSSRSGPTVLADRQRLLQVMLNLITNAVKYNRPGGRVDISCEVTRQGRVRLSVVDTGHGIRPEDMNRVFEPFDRLRPEQFGGEGTGVGLSLARNLVEQMGGSIEVTSVLEVGSTFCVDLPMAMPAEADDDSPLPVGEGTDVADVEIDWPGSAPAFKVLLVEQNLTSLDLVERVLSRRPGVVVLAAMHGRLALDLAREHRPDLVLADLHLPDMPGSVLLDRLGEDPSTAGIPVAILSGEPGSNVRRLLGRGVAGHVPKPIDVRALLSLVDAVRMTSGK